jgi:hypothetical protein
MRAVGLAPFPTSLAVPGMIVVPSIGDPPSSDT